MVVPLAACVLIHEDLVAGRARYGVPGQHDEVGTCLHNLDPGYRGGFWLWEEDGIRQWPGHGRAGDFLDPDDNFHEYARFESFEAEGGLGAVVFVPFAAFILIHEDLVAGRVRYGVPGQHDEVRTRLHNLDPGYRGWFRRRGGRCRAWRRGGGWRDGRAVSARPAGGGDE